MLVVDEHPAVRHAMASLFTCRDDMELVGEAATGEEAFRLCASCRPDVVLMAVTMRGMSASEATRAIRASWPAIQVLGMSTFQEEEQAPGLLEAGAAGYLLKNVTAEELARAIRSICAAPRAAKVRPHLPAARPFEQGQSRPSGREKGLSR